MKNYLLTLIVFSALSSHVYATNAEDSDLRSNPEFVATCPEEFLTYIDKLEGGPGAICNCPDENISYIDKSEGGPGFFCKPSE